MHRTSFAILLLCFAIFPAQAQTVTKDPAQAPSGSYTVDAEHTQVLFSVLHLGLTDYFGRFDKISGTLTWDGAQPERSALSVSIDTTSLDTSNERLNNQLNTAFRTQQYPAAIFKSTTIRRTGPDTGQIAGMLTIKDVTKPVTLDVTFNGSRNVPLTGILALGFRATATIRRSDFGLNTAFWSPFLSDDVQLIIAAMFDKQKS